MRHRSALQLALSIGSIVCATTACSRTSESASVIAPTQLKAMNVRRAGALRTERERSVYVIVANDCAASQRIEVKASIRAVIARERASAASAGERFAVIGIAIDWRLGDGLKAVSDLGPLDEVDLGRNWLNKSFNDLFRDYEGGRSATPSVVVTLRSLANRERPPGFAGVAAPV